MQLAQNASVNHRIILLVILLTATVVYLPGINNSFLAYDDPLLITNNGAVQTFDLKRLLTEPSAGLYHPLTNLSWAIDNVISPNNSNWFHFINITWHLVNCIIVFTLLRGIFPLRPMLGILPLLLFALHPSRAEVVAWAASRKDLVYSFFYLLTLTAYLTYTKNKKISALSLCYGYFILSLLSKPMAISLPFVLIIIDYLQSNTSLWRSTIAKLPLILLSLFFGIIAIQTQTQSGLNPSTAFAADNCFDALSNIIIASAKTLWPLHLSTIYENGLAILNNSEIISIVIFALTSTIVALSSSPNKKIIIFGVLFFLISIAPAMRLVNYGDSSGYNDRSLYLPALGLFIVIASIIEHILAWGAKRRETLTSFLTAGIVITIGLVCAILTRERISVWANTETALQDAIDAYPNSARPYGKLGAHYLLLQQPAQALNYYQKASALKPHDPDYLSNIALIHISFGRIEIAQEILRNGLAANPNDAQLLYIYGSSFLYLKDNKTAEKYLLSAADALKDRDDALSQGILARVYINLGALFLREKDFKKSIFYLESSLILLKTEALTYFNLAVAHEAEGQFDQARSNYFKALDLQPQRADILNHIGNTYLQEGNRGQAEEYFKKAQQINSHLNKTK